MTMYALLSDQDTAASETALCPRHYENPLAQHKARQAAGPDVHWQGTGPSGSAMPFTEIHDNPELHCIICGATS